MSSASILYDTIVSTLCTLVVNDLSLTSAEFWMYRGSLSSHCCGTEASELV
eukprot:CAMPEP_0117653942 /NCGR_PEP_ID=MMETSP0804-20121206/3471_1 /TAXON_ID=1074897 /ORGANISM="Tetraselmis astigmatica, Strain CCMP880" /LENGTH=50 /DNA_ID=CAMNT_0005460173 /DNA_START=46 /DNA_END=198 /DNA_ORIENTATION=-